MTRLPQLTDRDAVPEEGRVVFDEITEKRGRVGGPFALLMHSPAVAGHASEIGRYLRFASPLTAAARELATLAAARETDCAYEWAAHAPLALEAGVPQEAIDAVAHRKELEGVDEELVQVVRFIREVLRDHQVSDATFEAVHQRYGDAMTMELIALAGYYSLIAAVLNTMQVQPAEGAPVLPK